MPAVPDFPAPVPTHPLRWLASVIFGYPLVALIDHDGEVTVRLARKDALSRPYAKRFGFGIKDVLLIPGGTISPSCYVKRWVAVRGVVA